MCLLSIIIPTYNSSATIKKCINSILSQTFTNFEILIIDAVSTDNTIIISESFDDFRIKIHSEKDKGIYDAMNKGIKWAKGKWLYFLGSDDYLYSERILEKILSDSKLDYDVIYGNVISPRFNGVYNGVFSIEELFEKNICHQAIFFKKQTFKKIGLFNLKYITFADWDHNIRWFKSRTTKKKYVNEIIAFYADGGFSSHNNDTKFLNDKRWKLIKHNKNKVTFFDKIRMIKMELRLAFVENRRRDALHILIESPYLFI